MTLSIYDSDGGNGDDLIEQVSDIVHTADFTYRFDSGASLSVSGSMDTGAGKRPLTVAPPTVTELHVTSKWNLKERISNNAFSGRFTVTIRPGEAVSDETVSRRKRLRL